MSRYILILPVFPAPFLNNCCKSLPQYICFMSFVSDETKVQKKEGYDDSKGERIEEKKTEFKITLSSPQHFSSLSSTCFSPTPVFSLSLSLDTALRPQKHSPRLPTVRIYCLVGEGRLKENFHYYSNARQNLLRRTSFLPVSFTLCATCSLWCFAWR